MTVEQMIRDYEARIAAIVDRNRWSDDGSLAYVADQAELRLMREFVKNLRAL